MDVRSFADAVIEVGGRRASTLIQRFVSVRPWISFLRQLLSRSVMPAWTEKLRNTLWFINYNKSIILLSLFELMMIRTFFTDILSFDILVYNASQQEA